MPDTASLPKSTRFGVRCLSVAAIVFLINALVNIVSGKINLAAAGYSQTVSHTDLLISVAVMLVICVFVIYHISQGRRWARSLCCFVVIVGILLFIFGAKTAFVAHPIEAFVNIITLILGILGLINLYHGDSKAWFKR
mgnify:CR=1 FL=1|jgi:hypothetical protein